MTNDDANTNFSSIYQIISEIMLWQSCDPLAVNGRIVLGFPPTELTGAAKPILAFSLLTYLIQSKITFQNSQTNPVYYFRPITLKLSCRTVQTGFQYTKKQPKLYCKHQVAQVYARPTCNIVRLTVENWIDFPRSMVLFVFNFKTKLSSVKAKVCDKKQLLYSLSSSGAIWN